MSKAKMYGMPSKSIPNSKAPNPIKGAKKSVQFSPKRTNSRRRG